MNNQHAIEGKVSTLKKNLKIIAVMPSHTIQSITLNNCLG